MKISNILFEFESEMHYREAANKAFLLFLK